MKRVWAAYAALGLLLWPLPLLNVLQVESAAVGAFVSFFVAGWAATARFRTGDASVVAVLVRQEAALLVLLGMLTISQLWAPNCTVGQGLLFFALFPGVTVVLAVALAYALTGTDVSRPFLALGAIGVLISIAGPLYDLGFHPQFYTYNHVFGGVLGPIYDEQLAIRSGLFVFRGLTLLWAAAAFFFGRQRRGRGGGWGLAGCGIAIAAVYAFSPLLGINTTAERLQSELGGHVETPHFDIYYAPGRLDTAAVNAIADDHEAYYAELHRQLDLDPEEGPDQIQSYLYPNPDVKAQLTGARYTSVSPVWLGTPQVHMLVDRLDASLGHELAHVFSRPYGLPGLRASWAPGLIEGWAVALEPPDPAPSPHDLVQAATGSDSTSALSLKVEALQARLTPWGFWTGRGAVSYATMGSFVRFLLDEYGPDRLKRVYARGNFAEVYGRPLSVLVREWTTYLSRRPLIAWSAHEVVTQTFTRPSLFETECPHYVPPHRRHVQSARRAKRGGDSLAVDRHLRAALEAEPRYAPAHAALARRRLARNHSSEVIRQLDTLSTVYQTAELRVLAGDAHARLGNPVKARRRYEHAVERVPRYAHETRVRLFLRTAVADRPGVVKALTNGESDRAQAKHLARTALATDPIVQVWTALRYDDGHRYVQADSVWRKIPGEIFSGWVRPRRQEGTTQRRSWEMLAAYRAGRLGAATRFARDGRRRAAAHGAQEWARMFRGWVERAQWAQSSAAREMN